MSGSKFLKLTSLLITLSLFASVLVGCSASTSSQSPVLIKSFECDIHVVSRSRDYTCRLRRTDESSTLTVKEPQELDGLELEYQNGVYSVTFKGLTMSLDDSKTQLTQHFADGVMKVLDKTLSLEEISAKQENGTWIYEGETTYGEFEMSFDRDGKILGIGIPRLDTEITFDNFEEIK